jgi:hypothetical protein
VENPERRSDDGPGVLILQAARHSQVSYVVQGTFSFATSASVDTVANKDHGWRDRQIEYLIPLRSNEGS